MTKPKFDYQKLREVDLTLYKQLLFVVVRLFIAGVQPKVIVDEVYSWARDKAAKYYYNNGRNNITSQWITRRIKESTKDRYKILKLSFDERDLIEKIKRNVINADKIKLMIAPSGEELLRQVLFKFDEILTDKVKKSRDNKEIIVAVSGGSTLLSLSKVSAKYKKFLRWHNSPDISENQKKKVIVCSLTSGGTRDNIVALSDTIAALIAQELGVKARGLLGPAFFNDKKTRNSFKQLAEVKDHIKFVENADIILTSVSDVHKKESLTHQFIKSIDEKYLRDHLREYEHFADILYNCYEGFTGEPIPFNQKIKDRTFFMMTIEQLQEMVSNKQTGRTECIVAATGYNKGYHAIRGVMAKKMASHIYMDVECANGLIEVVEEQGYAKHK